MFKERRDVVVNALRKMGIDVDMPKATFYVWAAVPEGVTDSKAWCMEVLNEIAVWMIPGAMYGKYGEGYFRIALTHPADRLAQAMERLGDYLG
jgi:LL-diaminopimelate aminotransferase